MIKYAVFNVLNRFQTYSSNSTDCTITTFDVFALQIFFFTMLRVQMFFMPFGALQFFFLQILPYIYIYNNLCI